MFSVLVYVCLFLSFRKNRSETIQISFQGFECRAVYKNVVVTIIIKKKK